MPGPFTNIYTACRVADLLAEGVCDGFVRSVDSDLGEDQAPDPDLVAEFGPNRRRYALTQGEHSGQRRYTAPRSQVPGEVRVRDAHSSRSVV
jgi:hypothetical protein